MRTNTFFRFATPLFFVAILLSACHTAQKFAESGDYDGAIDFCVKHLQGKSKKKTEYVQGLEAAFQKAQARDFATINHLMDENLGGNWEKIHNIHLDIRDRQNKIAPLLPLASKDGYTARFDFVDIAKLESESRSKAAEFLYNKAKDQLAQAERGDKMAARHAYYSLLDIERHYYRDYMDKDQLKDQARDLGTSYILFEVKNQSDKVLPRSFAERVLNIGKYELDSEWKAFYFEAQPGVTYDYKVVYKIRDIDISPERVNERAYIDEKEIEDGWDYVLDSKGNVLKDSLGNDVKTRRYVRVSAQVLEVFQTKAARLNGTLEVYDSYRNTLLENRKVGTEVVFENYASTFSGDRRALSPETCVRIGNRPMPFPHDEDMLVQAADRLKPRLKDELRCTNSIL